MRVPKEQGVAAFWRGNLANVIRYFPTQALNFMFKDEYKLFRKGRINKNSPFSQSCVQRQCRRCCWCHWPSARRFHRIVCCRCRNGKDREFKGTVDTIMKTAKKQGMLKGGVYNGFWISCGGIIVYRASIKSSMFPECTCWTTFFHCIGYTVTTVAGLAAYPVDTVRRRMMMNSGSGTIKYSSSLGAFATIAKEEGTAAFFKGAGSNILRGLAGTLVLVGFDEFKKLYIKMMYPDFNVSFDQ